MLMGEPQFLLQVALVGLAARYSFECTVLKWIYNLLNTFKGSVEWKMNG